MPSNKNFEDLLARGVNFHQQNNLDEARKIYVSLLNTHPNNFDLLFLLGTVNLQLNNFSESTIRLKRAISINGSVPEAYFNLGLAYEKLGKFQESIANYEHATQLQPNYIEAYVNRGNLLQALRRYQEALDSYDKAISLNPNHAESYNNRGNALQALLKTDEALISYDKAISLNPNHAESYNNRGNALQALLKSDEALISYEKAISLNPNYVDAYNNLGNLFKYLGKVTEAKNNYSRALSLNPKFLPALYNSAVISFDQGDLINAIKLYKELIAIDPKHPDGNWNLSICYLMIGNYELGWEQYEYRWLTPSAPFYQNKRLYSKPLWSGKESLNNKTIFIYFEQGYGDTIQFCRYMSLFNELGANVILQVQKPLLMLLKSLGGAINLIPDNCNPPNFDYHCPLLSLPLAFRTRLGNIPKYQSYIAPNTDKVEYWKSKLGPKNKFRVGLSWSSTSNFKDDHKRSLSFAQFANLFPNNTKDFEFICLQKEIKTSDKVAFSNANMIQFYGNELEDFSDTAALMSQVDLVISTCTSIPHLSCAMGIPTWILLSYVPDWRWLMKQTDSPWYPSATLYRQNQLGEWSSVLEQIRSDLSNINKYV